MAHRPPFFARNLFEWNENSQLDSFRNRTELLNEALPLLEHLLVNTLGDDDAVLDPVDAVDAIHVLSGSFWPSGMLRCEQKEGYEKEKAGEEGVARVALEERRHVEMLRSMATRR